MSITLNALIVVGASVAAALAIHVALGRLIRSSRVSEAESTAGVTMEAMANLYGVLLAFILSGAWGRLDDARSMLTHEANALLDLKQIARLLPAPTRDELESGIEAYRYGVLEELRRPEDRRPLEHPDSTLNRLWQIAAAYDPETPGQTELQSRALDTLEELGDQRRLRIRAFQRPVPGILWTILIGGAVVVISLTALTSTGGRLPAAYVALLAAMISFGLFAIWVLSHPVRSGLAASAPYLAAWPR